MSDDELLTLAREWAAELRKDYTYAESNRDDWFATMPPEISAAWLKRAEMLEGLIAMHERHRAEVERLMNARAAMIATVNVMLEKCFEEAPLRATLTAFRDELRGIGL